jgi:hypothetical protein
MTNGFSMEEVGEVIQAHIIWVGALLLLARLL